MSINNGAIGGFALNNSAAAVPETGQLDYPIEQNIFEIGQLNCPIEQNIVESQIDRLDYTIEQRITGESGIVRLWVTSDIFETGRLNCIIEQRIGTFGSINQVIEQRITETGQLQNSIEQQIYDPADFGAIAAGDCTRWRAIVTLGGVNVSDRLTGVIRVEAEESTQRVGEFTLRPKGNAVKTLVSIALEDWVNQRVTIDYATLDASGAVRSQVRIFTGKVDEPTYDPNTRLVTFSCVDNMLVELENMPRAIIDILTPDAKWTDLVFDVDADNYEYTQDRMTTAPYALDKDRIGAYRWTPWLAKPGADFSFTTGDIVDASLEVELQPGRDLVNDVNIDFQYKFDRKRQRKAKFEWKFPSNFCEYLGVGISGSWTLPNIDMIQQAAEGTGWCLESLSSYKLPPTQLANCGGQQVPWTISDTLRNNLAFDVKGTLVKRFLQSISENYVMKLQAPTSIAAFGSQMDNISQRIVAKADLTYWENDTECCEPQINQKSVGGGSDDAWETWEDCDTAPIVEDGTDRIGMEFALQTKICQAQNIILDSHRQNRVSFDTPMQPTIERYHTCEIDTDSVDARGKVLQILHTLDLTGGSAITSVVLAISKNGTGVATQTPLAIPTKPDTTQRLALLSQTQRLFATDTHYGGIAFPTGATRLELTRISTPDPIEGSVGAGGSSLGDAQPIGGQDPQGLCSTGTAPGEFWLGYVGNKVPADIGSLTYSERFVLEAEDIDEIDRAEEEAEASQAYTVVIPDDLLALAA